MKKHKVILMFSGGLDSILSTKILVDEGFEVIALHFYNGYNGSVEALLDRGPKAGWTAPDGVREMAERLGATLMPVDISEEFTDILLHPKHGYGSQANPCIDCRIFLLKKATEIMESEGAILIATGEVMGQRPMSQHKSAMRQVEKNSGLTGRLLRPLCAKLLPPTIAEEEGIVNRDHLFGISGRSRHPQMELAKKFGIDDFPSPAGGCALTTIQYGAKFKDMLKHSGGEDIPKRELDTLLTGRHLRLESGIKLVIGRNEIENEYLVALLGTDFRRFRAKDFTGPILYSFGELTDKDKLELGAITARYGKGLHEEEIVIASEWDDESEEFMVKPATPEHTSSLHVCQG